MTLSEKLYQTIKDFPESLIAEVPDFAEFLKRKRQPEKIENAGGEFLIELKGGWKIPRPWQGTRSRFRSSCEMSVNASGVVALSVNHEKAVSDKKAC
jgi:hypothetical protein